MRLRSDIGEVEEVLADWWQEFSLASDSLRRDMVDAVREEQGIRQRAPRVHRAPAHGDAAADTTPAPARRPRVLRRGGQRPASAGRGAGGRVRRATQAPPPPPPGGARPAGDGGNGPAPGGFDD